MNTKYIWLLFILIGFSACNDPEDVLADYNIVPEVVEELPPFTSGSVDFSNYVALGASFTAGFADGGLFIAGQEDSFPNIIATQLQNAGIMQSFIQPLMNDNTGGILVGGTPATGYRLVFFDPDPNDDESGRPAPLNLVLSGLGMPVPPITTEAGNNIGSDFNNFGVPGAKSFHVLTPGYGAFNPFYARIASSSTATMLGDAAAQNPTFFTLSEMGGNDVLSYATTGGTGVDQTGNLNPATYGNNDITDPIVFTGALSQMITTLTANGAKGLVTNVPYITDLPHFTTVPYNAIDPSNPDIGSQIEALNTQLYGPLDNIFTAFGEPDRVNLLSATAANPLLISDEDAPDRSAQIAAALTPVLGAATANAFGAIFGKARQATAEDLLVLTAASAIGVPVGGAPAPINIRGISYPMEDQWVLLPNEQMAIRNATDAYNNTIESVANSNTNIGLVDLKSILSQLASTGYPYGDYVLSADLVTGGAVSLDGIHLTARGNALMAAAFLEAIDANFGSNFAASGNLPDASLYGTNYSATLK